MSNISPSPSSVDVTGRRFGRLVAVKRHVIKRSCGKWGSQYECQCDCGSLVTVSLTNLSSGSTKSCGCLRKESVSQRKRLPDRAVALRQVWNYYKRNAAIRGIAWNLSLEKLQELVMLPCSYCGSAPRNETKVRSFSHGDQTGARIVLTNGIDRSDNDLGYNDMNCVTACKRCNIAKSTMSKNEFLSWIDRVHKHQHMKDL